MKINISTIIEAIEMADDNFTFFLDLETGKSVLLADELSTGMDNEGWKMKLKITLSVFLGFQQNLKSMSIILWKSLFRH